MADRLNSDFVEKSAALLLAMANSHRLDILETLEEGELSVGELNKRIPISQSSLSQHLAVLRAQRLVAVRREAQTIYYSMHSQSVSYIMHVLRDMFAENSDD